MPALSLVLESIESVRNTRALYLLMLTFGVSGLLLAGVQRAMAQEFGLGAGAQLLGAFLALFYGTNAAGLVVMDEALGRPCRHPLDALRDAARLAHRLLIVVLLVLLVVCGVAGLVLALLTLARLPGLGPTALSVVWVLAVPLLGLAALTLVTLVGPLAAPAVWFGLPVRAVLALVGQQLRRRYAHAVMLSAAASLMTAAVAGLVSFVVLAGGRAAVALAVLVLGLDLAPQPVMAALFGQGLRLPAGAPPLSALTSAALTGAGVVFALGLVVPGVVYLRGLCAVFLALRALDPAEATPTDPGADPETPPAA